MRGRRLPRGFIFLGNIGDEEIQNIEQIKEASDIYQYDNARIADKKYFKR